MRARGALMATGVTAAGDRELLGVWLGDRESKRSRSAGGAQVERRWSACFVGLKVGLKARGRAGVDLVVSDHHGGVGNACRPGPVPRRHVGQRCQTHRSATIADATPNALYQEVPDPCARQL